MHSIWRTATLTCMLISSAVFANENAQMAILQQVNKGSSDAERIEKVVPLPMTSGINVVETADGQIHFVSAKNARFALQGSIYDAWQRKTISSIDEAIDAHMVPLESVGVNIDETAHFKLGNQSIQKQGTIFASPGSKATIALLRAIKKFPKKYNFDVVIVATNDPGSLEETKRLWCSPDRKAATSDLISGEKTASKPPSMSKCNIDPLIKSSVALNVLSIRSVPTIVRVDGLMRSGSPRSLDDWLNLDLHKTLKAQQEQVNEN